jgi:hypothetical protein
MAPRARSLRAAALFVAAGLTVMATAPAAQAQQKPAEKDVPRKMTSAPAAPARKSGPGKAPSAPGDRARRGVLQREEAPKGRLENAPEPDGPFQGVIVGAWASASSGNGVQNAFAGLMHVRGQRRDFANRADFEKALQELRKQFPMLP